MGFLGCRGEVLLHSLEQRDIYVSTGAACSSRKKGSHVLAAAGLRRPPSSTAPSVSASSEFNTVEQMDYVLVELEKSRYLHGAVDASLLKKVRLGRWDLCKNGVGS